MSNFLVRNETPHQLVLEGESDMLKLAPLQRTRVGEGWLRAIGPAALAARRDQAVAWEREPTRSRRLVVASWLAAVGISAGLVGALVSAFSGRAWVGRVGGVLAVLLVVLAAWALWQGDSVAPAQFTAGRRKDRRAAVRLEPSATRGDAADFVRDFAIAVWQGAAFVVVVVVALAAPAMSIYYGTELSDYVAVDGWSLTLVQGADAQYIVVGRTLQLVLLVLVSLTPALMFFQFDREKRTTLVDRWLHAVFRLDPGMRNVADVDAKYGRRVEEYYGAGVKTGKEAPRRRLQDRSPVTLATVLLAVGWIVVLLGTDRSQERPSFRDLFTPQLDPMTMAFLGAYFLSVQVTLRGYVRGDLKPKTYNVITVRVLMAVILAWAMQALWGSGDGVLVASFLAGIIPNTVLRLLRDAGAALRGPAQVLQGGTQSEELTVRSPLTLLDEIDVYERTRLEEEGITSIQALARHDLIDLMLSSRIPASRLIDWVDQALLLQHLERAADVAALRSSGVRSATDLLRVAAEAPSELEALLEKSLYSRVKLLTKVLRDDGWMPYVTHWRAHDPARSRQEHRYDSRGQLQVQAIDPLAAPQHQERALVKPHLRGVLALLPLHHNGQVPHAAPAR